MFDTITLLTDVNCHTTPEITSELKEEILKLLPTTLNNLFQQIGFSRYKQIMVAIHFMVVDDGLSTFSPYDMEAPEPPNHEIGDFYEEDFASKSLS